MEIELKKRSNLYKALEEKITINFFDHFKQICDEEDKDYDETLILIFNIVILFDIEKFVKNFWTIRIIDFYCFDTNKTLVKFVNLAERESRDWSLDRLPYANVELFKDIMNYASPKVQSLNDKMKLVRIKYKVTIGDPEGEIDTTYYTIINDKLGHIRFNKIQNHFISVLIFEGLVEYYGEANDILNLSYGVYQYYTMKFGESYARKLFSDLILMYDENTNISTDPDQYSPCEKCDQVMLNDRCNCI